MVTVKSLADLKHTGVRRIAMVSGDRQPVAVRVAKEIGCEEVVGECLPQNKVEFVRAMKAKGYWADQPNEAVPYPTGNVPPAHLADLKTFYYYTKGFGAIPNSSFGPATGWSEVQWSSGATRGWFAQTLWTALNSYWSLEALP